MSFVPLLILGCFAIAGALLVVYGLISKPEEEPVEELGFFESLAVIDAKAAAQETRNKEELEPKKRDPLGIL